MQQPTADAIFLGPQMGSNFATVYHYEAIVTYFILAPETCVLLEREASGHKKQNRNSSK